MEYLKNYVLPVTSEAWMLRIATAKTTPKIPMSTSYIYI